MFIVSANLIQFHLDEQQIKQKFHLVNARAEHSSYIERDGYGMTELHWGRSGSHQNCCRKCPRNY